MRIDGWMVLREAEQLAIIHDPGGDLVHILVDVSEVGSICKQLDFWTYHKLEEPQLLDIIRSMRDELRSL